MFVILTAVAFSVLAVFIAARPLAHRVGLVDVPGGRKQHAFETPLLGGVGIYVGVLVGVLLSWEPDPLLITLVGLSGGLLFLGLLDDTLGLAPIFRLTVEFVVVATCFHLYPSLMIDHIEFPWGTLDLGVLKWLVSVVLVVGVLNAFNLIDGIDGLAAVSFLIPFSVVGALALYQDGSYPLLILTITLGLTIFLMRNLSRKSSRKILLGDSGCLMLALILSVIFLEQVQSSQLLGVESVNIGLFLWAVALPVFDMLAVSLCRLRRGVSVFQADRNHVHHLLLERGLSPARALVVLGALSGAFLVVGLFVGQLSPASSVTVFCVSALMYAIYRRSLIQFGLAL